jgi:hypothetical protein
MQAIALSMPLLPLGLRVPFISSGKTSLNSEPPRMVMVQVFPVLPLALSRVVILQFREMTNWFKGSGG